MDCLGITKEVLQNEDQSVLKHLGDNFVRNQILMAKKKASPLKYNWQGAQILRDDSHFSYYEETENAAQQRIWTF